ncbi:DUF4870 domain-containing protein [Robertkochia sediminum]|uniref:DUF4870 domain-containing protein n=1 Tax=Robertkochia sediminum TaxID=2785326 RepID=UPI0019316BB6|nr:DUF4870 domain-containing protein [Robertkochia sediminum]MBL7473660.1 DUF4870 domain-containing protein [Robertkochia sediminum]
MDTTLTKHQMNLASIIHISTFSKYFFPFGNFILPLILWISNKSQSSFVDINGRNALNFQISVLLYSLILGIVCIPFLFFTAFDFFQMANLLEHNTHSIDLPVRSFYDLSLRMIPVGIAGLLFFALLILDVACSIIAGIRASKGILYNYPLTINFIK